MPLNVAIQMDPMEKVNIAGDSSFAIMLSGQARGHRLWHYDVRHLSYSADGALKARARPVTVQRVEGDHHAFGDWETIDLRGDIDVVLMRQDPPFDLSYITATHLLERIQPDTLVVNDPAAVRNAPEKIFVLDFAEFMPPTLITRSLDDVRAFQRAHGEIVVKPI
ncbi:MAG: glutathione synthase, partial [Parasphingopyxis sp.]